MGLETRGFIPPGEEEFQAPGKNKENLIKKSMKPEKKVTYAEMRNILMGKNKQETSDLHTNLMEDLAEEEIKEMRKKEKKEKLVDEIIAKMKNYINSPEHLKKKRETILNDISDAIKKIEEQGEDVIKLKIAGQKTGATQAQPIPKEFQGQILEGTEDEEETKIGISPLITEDYNQVNKEANS